MRTTVCYFAAWPFLIWALVLSLGANADTTRVPFLIAEGVALGVSIHAMRKKYHRRHER